MCNGTGIDHTSVTELDKSGLFSRIVGYMETGWPCHACFGHGRDAE
jgi:hypothetical protein